MSVSQMGAVVEVREEDSSERGGVRRLERLSNTRIRAISSDYMMLYESGVVRDADGVRPEVTRLPRFDTVQGDGLAALTEYLEQGAVVSVEPSVSASPTKVFAALGLFISSWRKVGHKRALFAFASNLHDMWLELCFSERHTTGWFRFVKRVYAHVLAVWAVLSVWSILCYESVKNGVFDYGASWTDTLTLEQLDTVGRVHTSYSISWCGYSLCPFSRILMDSSRALGHRLSTGSYYLDRDLSRSEFQALRVSLYAWRLIAPTRNMWTREKALNVALQALDVIDASRRVKLLLYAVQSVWDIKRVRIPKQPLQKAVYDRAKSRATYRKKKHRVGVGGKR